MLMSGYSTSGTSHDFFAFNSAGQVWNGSAFANWSDGSYTTYRIAATETGTSGRFTATAPTGTERYALRVRAGTLATSTVVWEDTALIDTEISSRLAAASYTAPDNSGIATLISGVNLSSIAGYTVAVDTNTAGQVSFISNAYVATSGGTVSANVVQVNGENVRDDGNGGAEISTTQYDAIIAAVGGLPAPLDAAGTRAALGMTAANLDEQLDTILDGTTTGTGARTITITVNDGTDPLENAKVRLTAGAATYTGDTNAAGEIVFNVNDATYTVAIALSGYSFAGASLEVSDDASQAYSMTATTVTPASDPGQTNAYVTCYASNGLPQAGIVVTVVLETLAITNSGYGHGYSSASATGTSGSDGVAVVVIPRGSSLRFKARRGEGTWYPFAGVDSGSVAMPDLVGQE